MKARLAFYCAAVIALVLFLAATSHATERRDPVTPEQIQAPSNRAADSAKPVEKHHAKKSIHPPAKTHTQAKLVQKKNPGNVVGTAGSGK
jgi:hypothetical protein